MQRSNTQTRELLFDVAERAPGSELIPVVVSSDDVVDVADGPEILVHTLDAVDLRRAPLPIIATHRGNQVNVGVVENISLTNGQMRGDARFGERQEAAEYKRDVINKIIRSVSVGYARLKGSVRKDGVLITTRWMPTHVAMVAEPADVNAGFFRERSSLPDFELSEEDTQRPDGRDLVSQPAARAAHQENDSMSTQEIAAAGAVAEAPAIVSAPKDALAADRERCAAVADLCRAARIDARIEQQWKEDGTPLSVVAREIREVQEARAKEKPQGAAVLGMTNAEAQRYSLFKAIRAMHYGVKDQEFVRQAAFEIECSRAVAKQLGREGSSTLLVPAEVLQRPVDSRAMAVSPGGKGGYLVSTENAGFIDILRNRSVLMSMGATVMSGLTGNVTIPRQTASPSVTWQAGDHASITAADQTLGQLSMTPKTAIAITDVSEQLLRQSSPSAESLVMSDLARVVALGVDSAGINGSGGAQPVGIRNTAGVTTGQAANAVDYAKVLAFVSTAASANAILSNPGFVTNAAGAAILMAKQRFSNTDTPLWNGNILDGQLVGFRAMASEQLASGHMIFGSWGEVVIGEWGVLELSTDNGGTRFNTAAVGIRAMWMVDVLVRYPQAFVVSTNLAAS